LLPLTNPTANASIIMNETQETQRFKPMVFPKLGEAPEPMGKILEELKDVGVRTPQRQRNYEEPTKPLDIIQKRLRNEDSSSKEYSEKGSILTQTTGVPRSISLFTCRF